MKHIDLSSHTDHGILICLTYACNYTCDIDWSIGMFIENICNSSNTDDCIA